MIVFSNTAKKSAPDRDPRIVHIDEWQQLSDRKRDDSLGTTFFEDTKTFFNLSDAQVAPRFRPAIRIPELQMMCMKEANDLSEFSPQAYIYNRKSDSRLEPIENAFLAQWERMQIPYHLLFAFVASQFMGTSFLQYGIDPYARNGQGAMWTKWRTSKDVHPDPSTDYTLNWSYVITDDWLHLDEIKRQYPTMAKWFPRASRSQPKDLRNGGQEMSSGFRLPEGPMRSMPPFTDISSTGGVRSRLRTTFMLDYSREIIGEMPVDPNAEPKYRWQYPRGRIIQDCEGVVLADGPAPFRKFPLIPVWATPPLFGIWAVPPTKYTQSLQDLAERTYTQTYENFYRLNNGIWMIPQSANIEQGAFGGIPGEKCTYEGPTAPSMVTPPQFPESSLKLPEQLLEKQRTIHGFTQARQGNPGSGNVSADLFDSAVLRGQSMTQLRGRLASSSVTALAEGLGYAMLEFLPGQKMALKGKQGEKFQMVDYKKPPNADDIDMFIDDGAFHVKSQAAVGKIAETLMAKGAIPVKDGLDMIGYPDADKIGTAIETQQALQAISSVTQPKGGKK